MGGSEGNCYDTNSLLINIDITDNDEVGVYLYTIESDKYEATLSPNLFTNSYKVQFLNFYCNEGNTVAYGVKLESEPTANVIIKPNITLLQPDENSTILEPPVLQPDSTELTFTPDNWNTHQRIKLTCLNNDVDHERNRFEIVHLITSNDSIYSS